MKHFRLLSITCLIMILVLLSGCSKKKDDSNAEPNNDTELSAQASTENITKSPKETSTTEPSTEGILIKDVVTLWDNGQKGAAVLQFLYINWQDASVLDQIRGLSMSERDLISLSENDRKNIIQETMTVLSSMRELFFHIASEAELLASLGNKTMAEEHLAAIRNYGNSLSKPDHLHVVQMHGKAATSYAEKKLSELQ